MQSLYEYLRVDLGMTSPELVLKKVQQYKNNEIENLISYIFKSVKSNAPVNRESIFDFKVNSTLSGDSYPCSDLSCRLKKLEELMRFSSLYADSVYITSPFDKYMKQLESIREIDRFSLGIDIIILLELESLVSTNIVKFQSEYICLCPECSKQYNEDIQFFENTVGKSYNAVLEECATKIKCNLLVKNEPEILISNAEEYGSSHDSIISFKDYIPESVMKILKKRKSNNIKLEKQDIINIGLPNFMLDNAYNDVLMNYIHSRDSNVSYLTDRKLDTLLLNNLNENKTNDLDLLNHTLSIIPKVNINSILELRIKDGESFQLYRDTLNRELKKLKNPNENEIIDFQRDIIQPELNKMNLVLKNHKKHLMRETKRDVLIWGGILSIGVFSGILNNNYVNLFNTIGGAGTIYNMYDKLDKSNQDYPVNNEQYYFLWKLNNA